MSAVRGFSREQWDIIHEGKREVVQLVWDKPDSPIWYLIDLINSLQQVAVVEGWWKFPESPPSVKKSSIPGPEQPIDGELCWDLNRQVGMQRVGEEWEDIPYSTWITLHLGGER